MAQINIAKREINLKIVYYGPGLAGKTTNLEVIHKKAPPTKRGDLSSIATEGDRTLYFDFMPLDLGHVGGMNAKLRLYTVPGQVKYNATRKLVLQGVDGVAFVADSQKDKMPENVESVRNLEENLREMKLELKNVPHVFQWNKRDLPDTVLRPELDKQLNRFAAPAIDAAALAGEGVFETLKTLTQLVLDRVKRDNKF